CYCCRHIDFCECFVRCNSLCRCQLKWPHEHRQSIQYAAFTLGQQVITPIEHCLKRLMPGQRATPTLPEKIEAAVEQFHGPVYAIRTDATSSQFYCQCNAIH